MKWRWMGGVPSTKPVTLLQGTVPLLNLGRASCGGRKLRDDYMSVVAAPELTG